MYCTDEVSVHMPHPTVDLPVSYFSDLKLGKCYITHKAPNEDTVVIRTCHHHWLAGKNIIGIQREHTSLHLANQRALG
jgi:hypothetical protein